jgi:ribosomal protein S17
MIEETRPISKLKTWKVVNNEKTAWYIMKLT